MSGGKLGRGGISGLGVRGEVCAEGPTDRPGWPRFYKECLFDMCLGLADRRMKYPG